MSTYYSSLEAAKYRLLWENDTFEIMPSVRLQQRRGRNYYRVSRRQLASQPPVQTYRLQGLTAMVLIFTELHTTESIKVCPLLDSQTMRWPVSPTTRNTESVWSHANSSTSNPTLMDSTGGVALLSKKLMTFSLFESANWLPSGFQVPLVKSIRVFFSLFLSTRAGLLSLISQILKLSLLTVRTVHWSPHSKDSIVDSFLYSRERVRPVLSSQFQIRSDESAEASLAPVGFQFRQLIAFECAGVFFYLYDLNSSESCGFSYNSLIILRVLQIIIECNKQPEQWDSQDKGSSSVFAIMARIRQNKQNNKALLLKISTHTNWTRNAIQMIDDCLIQVFRLFQILDVYFKGLQINDQILLFIIDTFFHESQGLFVLKYGSRYSELRLVMCNMLQISLSN